MTTDPEPTTPENEAVTRRLVYVAHPLNAPTRAGIEKNLRMGAFWCGFLARHFAIAPVAPWIYLASVWDETPENRALGLEIDFAMVEACAELWMVGPRISSGMRLEAEHAWSLGKLVRDLTEYSPMGAFDPPSEGFRVRATELRWQP